MKKIPNVKLFLDKGFGGSGFKGEKLVKVYTLPPGKVPQEIILGD